MPNTAIQNPQVSDAIEAALLHGDLSKLNNAGRIQHYKAVCDSLGLNPLTQPFAYITLNGKLQLYAKKDCTDQLRQIHSISVVKLEKERIEDVYAVTAYVTNPKGRTDSSIGAVTIGGQKGDALANLLMKAETKAKRRATLSICGMGILDETEIDTIPDARVQEPPTQPSLVHRQLEASVEALPPETYEGLPIAEFKIVDAVMGTSRKGTGYVQVLIDGEVDSTDSLFCYHGSLQNALLLAKEQVARFTWKRKGEWMYLEHLLSVAGQEYREGKPWDAERQEFIAI